MRKQYALLAWIVLGFAGITHAQKDLMVGDAEIIRQRISFRTR